jgi:hypothetical protein
MIQPLSVGEHVFAFGRDTAFSVMDLLDNKIHSSGGG